MTARQSIGCWCLGCLVAGLAIGWKCHAYLRPSCTYVSQTAYNHLDEPLCVIVQQTKETE